MDSDVGSPESSGFDRRAFLARIAVGGGVAWAAPVITTVGLSRATATPCPAGVAASSPSSADTAAATTAEEEEEEGPDLSAQLEARSERTHQPCYQQCMERRAIAEMEAHKAFEAAAEKAGSNDTRLAAAAETHRVRLVDVARKFKECTGRCA